MLLPLMQILDKLYLHLTSSHFRQDKNQGPVVQSIVTIMKLLVKDLLSLLVHIKSSVLTILLKNCEELLQKLLTFFQQNGIAFTLNV